MTHRDPLFSGIKGIHHTPCVLYKGLGPVSRGLWQAREREQTCRTPRGQFPLNKAVRQEALEYKMENKELSPSSVSLPGPAKIFCHFQREPCKAPSEITSSSLEAPTHICSENGAQKNANCTRGRISGCKQLVPENWEGLLTPCT